MTNGRGNCIAEIMGWEKYGSETMLRVKLRDPCEAAVYTGFDGSGTFPPPPATRMLTDRMFTLKDLFRAVSDRGFADESGLGPGDIRKIKEALRVHRDQGDGASARQGRRSGDMRKYRPGVVIIAPGL